VSKLHDIIESLWVKNAIINISPIVTCYTTMSTLRHKHGCNQEFYNMHVLSHCTNKKKSYVSGNFTKTDIRVNPFYNVCQTMHNITKPAITVFTQKQEEVLFLKFGTQIHGVILNMCMTHWTAQCQTGLLWTRSCRAKPWPASTNHCVRSPFFWDTLQRWMVIPYKHFSTTYWSQLQGSRIAKQYSMSVRS
jgi:hypothetical protein